MSPPAGSVPRFDWRTIAALNVVSTLAQVGQFGFAFVIVPVWLANQGLGATELGLFAASLWLGQLPGLALAPWLCRRFGPRRVIGGGLTSTVIAMVLIASASAWPTWVTPLLPQLLGGLLAGLGLGLRWIGLEPWLYRIAPDDARGRLVGFHETLIALAPIIAPVIAAFVGLEGHTVFWVAAAFTLSALLPLAMARPPAPTNALHVLAPGILRDFRTARTERVFRQGMVIALLGGMLEAAVSGLFALFAHGRGITIGQTADLLAVFGLGGLLLQYGIGWLADHRGVGFAALWCAAGTALVALALLLPLTYAQTVIAVFLLGGCITAFLTLALIASTLTKSGSMASNVSLVSMFYTASAFIGPLLAGATMHTAKSDGLMGFTAVIAVIMAVALRCTLAPAQRSA